MDLHISVIADFKTACPDVDVVDWCLSSHAWVMKRKQDQPDHINPSTWQYLNPSMIQKFQERYDVFLSSFDGFVVGYCSAFAMIYEKYNKPIIMLNAVRYDIPFCFTKDMSMLAQWHQCLVRLNSRGLLTIVSNNKADQLYTLRGCGLRSHYIPSLCLYTKTRYTPTKSTFLLIAGDLPSHPLVSTKRDLPQPHEWSDVTQYRGIINFPYDVSLMSVFEHFTAGSPLFFPTKAYWKSNPAIQSVSAYWGNQLPEYLSDFKNPDTWIDLADMYGVFQSPNTYYFDSIPHLFQLLESFVYVDDSQFRKDHVDHVRMEWKRTLFSIVSKKFWGSPNRHMSYNRLPLLANIVHDVDYTGSGVQPQHTYPQKDMSANDIVFVKTDMLTHILNVKFFNRPVTLVTGVSDLSPSPADCDRILRNPNIRKWIGCNITVSHPKIVKLPIGVGEPERQNGNHDTLVRLHGERIQWEDKEDSVCIPYHGQTHAERHLEATLPKLVFEDYMRAISKHRFVVCQRGNGVDTHRICEVLLMGSVPVVEHSGLDDMYERWNTLIVDSFSDINTSGFAWDDAKNRDFLDTFWLNDALKDRLL